MSVADQFHRQTPEYYDFMYLDGYDPYEVYNSFKNKMRQQYEKEEQPLQVHFTYEVKHR